MGGVGLQVSPLDDESPSGRHIGLTIPFGRKEGFGAHTSNSVQLIPTVKDDKNESQDGG